MRKININEITEDSWISPKGKFAGFGKSVSAALGRNEKSTDLRDDTHSISKFCASRLDKRRMPIIPTVPNGKCTMSFRGKAWFGIKMEQRLSRKVTPSF